MEDTQTQKIKISRLKNVTIGSSHMITVKPTVVEVTLTRYFMYMY